MSDYFKIQAVLGRTEQAAKQAGADDWFIDSIEIRNRANQISYELEPFYSFPHGPSIVLLGTWHYDTNGLIKLRLPDDRDALKLTAEVLKRNRRLMKALDAAKQAFRDTLRQGASR